MDDGDTRSGTGATWRHPPLVEAHLPLSDAVFHLLLSLADRPRHGYGIITEVEERTGGAVRLGTGTLYSAVKRLRRAGLLAPAEAPEGVDDRRRYYRLTPLGREVLRAEADRLAALVGMARAKDVLPADAGGGR